METFGAYIKAHREKKGIRLEEIASITKIHIHALQHLEAGRWEKLPPEPFLRGFVIAYAKYVGLDEEECAERYRKERDGDQAEKTETAPEKAAPVAKETKTESKPAEIKAGPAHGPSPSDVIAEDTSFPLGKVMGFGATLIIVAVVAGLIYVGKQNAQQSTPVVVENEQPTTNEQAGILEEEESNPFVDLKLKADDEDEPAELAKTETDSSTGATETIAKETSTEDTQTAREAAAVTDGDGHKVVVQGLARTWMKVVVDDNPPIEYFLPKGKSAGYAAKQKIKVVVGDHRGVKVSHNENSVDGRRLRGNVSVFVFPQGARFPQDAPPPKKPASVTAPDNLP